MAAGLRVVGCGTSSFCPTKYLIGLGFRGLGV